MIVPIGSMYGIFTYIYIVELYGKLVGIYTLHPMDPSWGEVLLGTLFCHQKVVFLVYQMHNIYI